MLMTVRLNDYFGHRFTDGDLAPWKEIPTAFISDQLNRRGAMHASIKPVRTGMKMVGQALTIRMPPGDNSVLHYGVARGWPGAVAVVAAEGYEGAASWGGIVNHAARVRGFVGAVTDGVVRDAQELRSSSLAVFGKGAVPAGPMRLGSGEVNTVVQCGGLNVSPGDLIVGDDDGVVVVPIAQMAEVLEACRALAAREEVIRSRIDAGELTIEIHGMPQS